MEPYRNNHGTSCLVSTVSERYIRASCRMRHMQGIAYDPRFKNKCERKGSGRNNAETRALSCFLHVSSGCRSIVEENRRYKKRWKKTK